MTLIVLGIDALDHQLVEQWDLDNLRLDCAGPMTTYAHMKEVPMTQEMWPTMATGLSPEEHGITEDRTSEWSNPFVDFASRFTWTLPSQTRKKLGDLIEGLTGSSYDLPETDSPIVFDGPGRVVHDWPGVINSHWLQWAWQTATPDDETQTDELFKRDLTALGVQQLAWARFMLSRPSALAATHVHTVDMGGHIFARDEPQLREMYEWMDDQVGQVLNEMGPEDDLLILSDHGMVTEWAREGDIEVGKHSFRAMSSTTAADRPEDVYDVSDWVECHVPEWDHSGDAVDIPTEQLEDLGYI